MIFINRSEIERMNNNVIDQETGMTELDLFESQHCYEDWKIFENA